MKNLSAEEDLQVRLRYGEGAGALEVEKRMAGARCVASDGLDQPPNQASSNQITKPVLVARDSGSHMTRKKPI